MRHSISPALHAAAFEALGIDARYVTRQTAASDLMPTIRELAAGGGGNVTIPHKEATAAGLDVPSEAVLRSGACNCFWGLPDGRLAGDNTDVAAFVDAVETLPGVRLPGARVLLLGGGGGARAVLLACTERGVERIDILNRSPERAAAAADFIVGDTLPVTVLEQVPTSGRYDLVVNATSVGLRPSDPLPIELDALHVTTAFDLVYGVEGTRWTRHARTRGVTAADGLDMLVHQAGYSIRRWLDVDPPLDVMRRAATAALSDLPDG